VQLYGYQVSNQCAALVASDSLVPTVDAPELAYTRESTGTHYVPTVNYMACFSAHFQSGRVENRTIASQAKDKYGNDVRKEGRPLPVEYLMVDVPAGQPLQPRHFFHAIANHFPIENRTNDPQVYSHSICPPAWQTRQNLSICRTGTPLVGTIVSFQKNRGCKWCPTFIFCST